MGTTILFVEKINAARTLEIVYELRAMKLEQGTDFKFKFIHKQDTWFQDDETPWGAEFTFTDEKWATWFTLKYL
jgi:hypothetical protein